MDLAEIITLAKAIAICPVLATANRESTMELAFDYYDCFACVGIGNDDSSHHKKVFHEWANSRLKENRHGLLINYTATNGRLGAWPVSRMSPSRTQQLLDAFVAPPAT